MNKIHKVNGNEIKRRIFFRILARRVVVEVGETGHFSWGSSPKTAIAGHKDAPTEMGT
jgi:hypothetical protein